MCVGCCRDRRGGGGCCFGMPNAFPPVLDAKTYSPLFCGMPQLPHEADFLPLAPLSTYIQGKLDTPTVGHTIPHGFAFFSVFCFLLQLVPK